jgi:DTW domain-containing protein YfiP
MSLVRSERTEKYCINISEHYCSHWEDIHAFREALQNWMDAWKEKYLNKKFAVKFEENKALKIYSFYLVVDGVKNT